MASPLLTPPLHTSTLTHIFPHKDHPSAIPTPHWVHLPSSHHHPSRGRGGGWWRAAGDSDGDASAVCGGSVASEEAICARGSKYMPSLQTTCVCVQLCCIYMCVYTWIYVVCVCIKVYNLMLWKITNLPHTHRCCRNRLGRQQERSNRQETLTHTPLVPTLLGYSTAPQLLPGHPGNLTSPLDSLHVPQGELPFCSQLQCSHPGMYIQTSHSMINSLSTHCTVL